MNLRAVIVGVVMCAPSLVGANSITLTGATGEFENRTLTERYTLEVRQGLGPVYAIGYAMKADHPRHEITDRVMGGLGLEWRGWNAEMVGDDDRYLTRLIYTADTDRWELRGGVLHGNKWEEGLKQTGLMVSVGYPLGPVSVGAFYEIGNTTMTAVDDLHGGYLTWRY